MSNQPSRQVATSIRDQYSKNAVDLFDLTPEGYNPLKTVVPCFDLMNGDAKPFFGPYVLNIVSLTGVLLQKTGSTYFWNDTNVNKCKEIIKKAYKYFSLYRTYYFIDTQADDITGSDVAAVNEMENKIIALVNDLKDYGFIYLGRLQSTTMDSTLRSVVKAFYDTVKTL